METNEVNEYNSEEVSEFVQLLLCKTPTLKNLIFDEREGRTYIFLTCEIDDIIVRTRTTWAYKITARQHERACIEALNY